MNSKIDFDIIVIGGGASGLMAAGRAAGLGKKVLLIEKNYELGKKLKITGGYSLQLAWTTGYVAESNA